MIEAATRLSRTQALGMNHINGVTLQLVVVVSTVLTSGLIQVESI